MRYIPLLAASFLLLAWVAVLEPSSAVRAAPESSSGIDFQGIDASIAPGDDFDNFANGGWYRTIEIPSDRPNTGTNFLMTQLTDQKVTGLVRSIANSRPKPGTDEARIADYYAAYVDTLLIERLGGAPLEPLLSDIASIRDKHDLAFAIGSTIRADVDPINAINLHTENLAGVFVSQALADPKRTVPYLLQGGIGLPDRDYFLSNEPRMRSIRSAYTAYVSQLLRLAQFSDAQARAERIVALETKIAAAQATIEQSLDPTLANNPYTPNDFERRAPGLDWPAFFKGARLAGQPQIVVWQPETIARLSALVASEPLDVWKDWLAFHQINQMTDVLPVAFGRAHFAFYGTLIGGTPQEPSRDKLAVQAVESALGDIVGRRYVAVYFPAAARSDIAAMVKRIKAALVNRIDAITWMAPATKAEARRKVETMVVGIGYPNHWLDYRGLVVRSNDAFGNLKRARLTRYRQQLSKIGRPVERGEWWLGAQVVNAVNMPLQNAITFPAGILQKPLYDPTADAAVNYGAIGTTIGHEISHSFDNLGSAVDSQGRLRNWWTSGDLARFRQAAAALAAQYDAYEPLPGVHLKGQQELAENIADVTGLAAALQAYHASLNGNHAPVIDGLSGDQRFFLAFAQKWRSKIRENALRSRVATDVHAPAHWRIFTVRNVSPWYDAFHVTAAQKLYLAPAKRVRVW